MHISQCSYDCAMSELSNPCRKLSYLLLAHIYIRHNYIFNIGLFVFFKCTFIYFTITCSIQALGLMSRKVHVNIYKIFETELVLLSLVSLIIPKCKYFILCSKILQINYIFCIMFCTFFMS